MKANVLFSLVWLLTNAAAGPFAMAAESRNAVSPCAFEITAVERRYSYFADFAITVTNASREAASIRRFDGAPFEIMFSSGDKNFALLHKADEYAVERGASRRPEETKLAPLGATSFVVDLKGDYVVVNDGRPIPFRDFAAGKEGTVTIKPLGLNEALFLKANTRRLVKWDGKSIVLP